MRSTKQIKIEKSGTRTKISKKKHARKSNRAWGFDNNVSVANLENINEILRVHKTQHAVGKCSWQLVPKDSCEVYKERRKKQQQSQGQTSDEGEDNRNKTNKEKKRQEKVVKKKKKPARNYRDPKRRPNSESSVPSYSSCSSMSTAATTVASTDMEYSN